MLKTLSPREEFGKDNGLVKQSLVAANNKTTSIILRSIKNETDNVATKKLKNEARKYTIW